MTRFENIMPQYNREFNSNHVINYATECMVSIMNVILLMTGTIKKYIKITETALGL